MTNGIILCKGHALVEPKLRRKVTFFFTLANTDFGTTFTSFSTQGRKCLEFGNTLYISTPLPIKLKTEPT